MIGRMIKKFILFASVLGVALIGLSVFEKKYAKEKSNNWR
jgi:hypothetical protein